MRVSILIPAYNEAGTIGQVLDAIEQVAWAVLGIEREVVVVDDGSTDATAACVAAHAHVRLIRHASNQGKGGAIRTALAHATGEVVLIQDADLEYAPADYPRLLAPFIAERAVAVYGSRFLAAKRPNRMRWPNYLANRFGTWLFNRLYGVQLSDLATGHKVFHRSVLQETRLDATGFDGDAELTAKVVRRGIRIVEVPISYSARSFKEGKKFLPRHGLQALRGIVRYRYVPLTAAEPLRPARD